jgi:hypothetical protein
VQTIRPLPCIIAAVVLASTLALPDEALARTAGDSRPVTVERCSWDRPGANPYMGETASAVDHYRDIAPKVRERLKSRIARRDYDDVVSIERASITGRSRYGSTIRDMHFGAHRICHEVSRSDWSPTLKERGLVYCEDGQCILVPTVCRNVSRISRRGVADERIVAPPSGPAFAPEATTKAEPDALVLEAEGSRSFAAASLPSADEESAGSVEFGGSGAVVLPVVIGGGGGGGTAPPVPPIAPVPEPDTLILILAGLAATAAWQRRRKAAPKPVATT